MKPGSLIILKTGDIVEFLGYGSTVKIYEVSTLEDRFGQRLKLYHTIPHYIRVEDISEIILETVK